MQRGWLWGRASGNKVPHEEIRALRLGEIEKEPQCSEFRPMVSTGARFIKKGRQACVGEPTNINQALSSGRGHICLK